MMIDEGNQKDHKTDEVIQTSLRGELGKDVTLIAVAHRYDYFLSNKLITADDAMNRLQTIMDADRVMVLKDGHIVSAGIIFLETIAS